MRNASMLKLTAALAVLSFSPALFADEAPAANKSRSEHKELVVIGNGNPATITLQGSLGELPEPAKMVKAAFLGVGVSGSSDVLSEQLNLPQGVGLVVEFVEKGSPAEKAGVQAKDVLHKFNDQLLINPQQLATLVRTFKPGDAVKVTVIRKGESMTLDASLVEKELPELSSNTQAFEFSTMSPMPAMAGMMPLEQLRIPTPPDAPRVIRVMPGATSRIIKVDDGIRIELETRDGKRTLRVVDEDGKSVFDGPYNTKDEMDKLAPEYRDRVKAAVEGVELREVPATSPTEPKADAHEKLTTGPTT